MKFDVKRVLMIILVLAVLMVTRGRSGGPDAPETTAALQTVAAASAAETKPAETKAADTASAAETKPAETKAADMASAAETKPAETKAADTASAAETKPAETKPAETGAAAERRWTQADLKDLKNTKNFTKSAISHIFLGEINSRGSGAGYHYEGIEDSPGSVIEGTRSKPDLHGVYSGKVEVDGVKKTGNKGYSTFFPIYMTPQDVVDAINQAYENAERIGDNLYAGITDDGIEIDMYLTGKGKITTAYPVRED